MIQWITPKLGTAPRNDVSENEDVVVVDVRAMVDKAGNTAEVVRGLVDAAVSGLRRGKRVVVCCDYGMSRSNAIAAGAMAMAEAIPYDNALQRVLDATGERSIKLEVVAAIRETIEPPAPTSNSASTAEKRLLVTGGSGFLGRSIVMRLSSRHQVSAPDRQSLDLTGGATSLDLFIRRHRATDIIHLAHPRVFASSEAMGPSLVMLRNVLDVCRENALRLVFLSGWEVYSGYVSGGLVASEETPLLPRGAYGETKYLCECLLRQHQQVYGLRVALLRLGPVYGAEGDKPRFIRTFIRQAMADEPIVTHRYRNGDPSLDLLYIDDASEILSAIIRSDFTGVLNIGSGSAVSTPDIARHVVRILHSRSTIGSSPVSEYVANITMDASKVRRAFAWSPKTSIEVGLDNVCRRVAGK